MWENTLFWSSILHNIGWSFHVWSWYHMLQVLSRWTLTHQNVKLLCDHGSLENKTGSNKNIALTLFSCLLILGGMMKVYQFNSPIKPLLKPALLKHLLLKPPFFTCSSFLSSSSSSCYPSSSITSSLLLFFFSSWFLYLFPEFIKSWVGSGEKKNSLKQKTWQKKKSWLCPSRLAISFEQHVVGRRRYIYEPSYTGTTYKKNQDHDCG